MLLFVVGSSLNDSKGQTMASGKTTSTSEKVTKVLFDSSNFEIIVNNPVDGNYLVQVFNLTGSEIIRHDVLLSSSARIPASKLRNGVYIVRITPTPNQPSATFKIMVR